jgi:hypothetical protein
MLYNFNDLKNGQKKKQAPKWINCINESWLNQEKSIYRLSFK